MTTHSFILWTANIEIRKNTGNELPVLVEHVAIAAVNAAVCEANAIPSSLSWATSPYEGINFSSKSHSETYRSGLIEEVPLRGQVFTMTAAFHT
jgi:hypothetical protein